MPNDVESSEEYFDLELEEPASLDEVIERNYESSNQNNQDNEVKKEVMDSLRSLVFDAKKNANRVEQLSLDLKDKDKKIDELSNAIDAKTQELNDKDEELKEKNKIIEEQNSKIESLEIKLEENVNELKNANELVARKNEEIETLNTTLNSHKAFIADVQKFLNNAQPVLESQENTRKIV